MISDRTQTTTSDRSTRQWILRDRLPMRSQLITVKESQDNRF
ncbi:MAG: hypothetical protein WCO29_04185 [Nostocales cyanobacterium ELA583]